MAKKLKLTLVAFSLITLSAASPAFANNCSKEPSLCSNEELCFLATNTKNNKTTWNNSRSFRRFKAEAISRKLTCGVKITPKPELKNVAISDPWGSIFNQLSFGNKIKVQTKLNALGYYDKKIDGIWGKGTRLAVLSYATAIGLNAKAAKSQIIETYESLLESAKVPIKRKFVSSGTAFAVSTDGILLTNEHVIDECSTIILAQESNEFPATVLVSDKDLDLAVLKANIETSPLNISSQSISLMQDIFVAGFPFGDKLSTSLKVTRGIVSSMTGIGSNEKLFQIDAAIQPGNSGGPIYSTSGEVVGVVVSKLNDVTIFKEFNALPENTGFGIKIQYGLSLLERSGVSHTVVSNETPVDQNLASKLEAATFLVKCTSE